MGTWGPAAWDNDSAADWFADMFETTKLATHVEESLSLDPQESPDEIRAAAYVLVALGRTYVWPIDDLDRHIRMAIEKLEAIKLLYAEDDPDYETTIDDELAALKARIKSADA